MNISFSNVLYKDIAPLLGLNPLAIFFDVPLFDLHRSRIPTTLFKDIVKDMDILFMQFGTLVPTLMQGRLSEDARSRVLAPVSIVILGLRIFFNAHQIFNRLVAEFSGSILNRPESFMSGRIAKDRIDYQFRTCGFLTVVFVQVDLHIGDDDDRLNAIAQVIKECDGQASLYLHRIAVDFSDQQLATRSTCSDPVSARPYMASSMMDLGSGSSSLMAAPNHTNSQRVLSQEVLIRESMKDLNLVISLQNSLHVPSSLLYAQYARLFSTCF